MTSRIAVLALTLFVLAVASPVSAQYVVLDLSPSDIVVVGNGYDLARRSPTSTKCIQGGNTSDWPGASTSTADVSIITADNDVSEVLSISYSALMDATVTSDKMAFDLAQNASYKTDTVTAVFHKTSMATQPQILSDVGLTNQALNWKSNGTFRDQCGDYYIAGLFTGQRFFGVVNIDASVFDFGLRTSANFSESVKAALVSESSTASLSGQLNTAMQSSASSVYESSQGGNASDLTAVDLASMKADYKSFGSGSAYPFKVILSRYPDPDIPAYTDATTNEQYAKLWYQLYQIKGTADDVVADATAAFRSYLPNRPGQVGRWSVADMQSISNQANAAMGQLQAAVKNCTTSACPPPPATYATLVNALTGQLPIFAGRPKSCSDIDNIDPAAPNGDYDLYFSGQYPYHATCEGMSSNPQTYLKLAYPSQNFSQTAPQSASSGDTHGYWGGTMQTTTFSAIQVDPTTMTVTLDDYTFATTTGRVTGGQGPHTAYGIPAQCENWNCGQAAANLDLRNTGFVVDMTKSSFTELWSDTPGGGASVVATQGNAIVALTTPCGHCGTFTTKVVLTPAAP